MAVRKYGLVREPVAANVRGRHVRGSQDRLDYEITVGGASLRLGYVPGTTFICPSAKWHRQKMCSSPIGILPRISGHHSAQFWALHLRHAINRSDHPKYRSPVRHPPVHALDSIILQAQVLTPSGGRERPFDVHLVRAALQLRCLEPSLQDGFTTFTRH